jgi:hypothetical protein
MTVFDDDLDTMLEGFPTVTVVFDGITAEAYRDQWSAEVLPGMAGGVVAENSALTFPTSRFPGIAIGSSLTVDGIAFTVRDKRLPPDMADGAVTQVLLQKVAP